MDSFLRLNIDAWTNAGKCIDWIGTSSHDVMLVLPRGLGRRMVQEEWPRIKADIDSLRPSPLYLVAGPPCGLGDIPCITAALHHCHQVLAYAYSLDDANNLVLWVYDCNDPSNNSSTIELNIGNPAHTIGITANGIVTALGGGVTIRGIFREEYALREPLEIMSLLAPVDG